MLLGKSVRRRLQENAVPDVTNVRNHQQYVSQQTLESQTAAQETNVYQQQSAAQERVNDNQETRTHQTTKQVQRSATLSNEVMPEQLKLGHLSQQTNKDLESPVDLQLLQSLPELQRGNFSQVVPLQYQQQLLQQAGSPQQAQSNAILENASPQELPKTGTSQPATNPMGSLTGIFGSVPLASSVGSSFVPSLANPQTLHQLGQLAADIAECDPKKEGLCCMMRDYCDKNADCYSDASPENVFDIAGSIPTCVCRWGFEGDGRTKGSGCNNINECATSAAGCEQLCQDLTPGFACGCLPGFQLLSDGLLCEDINECNTRNGGCQHLCINTLGSYYCSCADGTWRRVFSASNNLNQPVVKLRRTRQHVG